MSIRLFFTISVNPNNAIAVAKNSPLAPKIDAPTWSVIKKQAKTRTTAARIRNAAINIWLFSLAGKSSHF